MVADSKSILRQDGPCRSEDMFASHCVTDRGTIGTTSGHLYRGQCEVSWNNDGHLDQAMDDEMDMEDL
ncbi:hypothetical protein PoB_000229400 [Plakobranchus ocellatus]|uniref:Kazal-like domain-containing protein n=1 Tax=Plakobranchus ocellatus TaxID=259542 RepID=A0AAV3Y1E4_9GAST|nr:hypothetical protein PoB_000229400 [Plakobranchus ocellatus]